MIYPCTPRIRPVLDLRAALPTLLHSGLPAAPHSLLQPESSFIVTFHLRTGPPLHIQQEWAIERTAH